MSRLALLACGASLASAVTTISLGQDVDYPPYAFMDSAGNLQGFGKDIADGMTAMCDDIEIVVVQTAWSNCWTSAGGGSLGAMLENGSLDACTTYTHTRGVRNEFADFSGAILNENKAAGLLTLLNKDREPKIDGGSDLSGITVVDVGGWAPTADTIAYVENKCTGKGYSDSFNMVVGEGNDAAMRMLRSGEADCMFLYADQAKNYQCGEGVKPTWNCTLWEGFGTEYAYVQTGQFGHGVNGTTLALTKKGSGVVDILNPCLNRFMETKNYYDVCVKHDLVDSCYRNEHFPTKEHKMHVYNLPTDAHEGDCFTGYCPCTGEVASGAFRQILSGLIAAPLMSMFV